MTGKKIISAGIPQFRFQVIMLFQRSKSVQFIERYYQRARTTEHLVFDSP